MTGRRERLIHRVGVCERVQVEHLYICYVWTMSSLLDDALNRVSDSYCTEIKSHGRNLNFLRCLMSMDVFAFEAFYLGQSMSYTPSALRRQKAAAASPRL